MKENPRQSIRKLAKKFSFPETSTQGMIDQDLNMDSGVIRPGGGLSHLRSGEGGGGQNDHTSELKKTKRDRKALEKVFDCSR